MGGSSGGGSSGSQTTSTTQTQEPWAEQKPYLIQGMEAAKKEYGSSSPEFYPGSTVVPHSAETEAALGMRTGQASDPNSLINRAGAETGKTLSGEYYQPGNPAFDAMMEGVTRQVRPGVDTGFASAGRSGTSPLHSEALARGITSGMLPYVQAERGRQYQASLDAGTTSQYAPALLADVGAAREGMSRQELQEDIDRHNFEQTKEANKIREYMANITGNYGGTTNAQTTQPIYSNSLQSGLGAATSAVGIGQGLFGSPGGGGLLSGSK